MADQGGLSFQTESGATIHTNHDRSLEDEWDAAVGNDPPNQANVMPPPATTTEGVEVVDDLEPLPQGWKDNNGAPTKKCVPSSYGEFQPFKNRMKLYKRGNAESDQICCWFSPYFQADDKVSQI